MSSVSRNILGSVTCMELKVLARCDRNIWLRCASFVGGNLEVQKEGMKPMLCKSNSFETHSSPAIMLVIRWLKKPAIMIMIILPRSENAHLKREREKSLNHPQKIQRQIFTVPYRLPCTDLKIILSWVWTPSPAPEEMSLELTWTWRSRLSGERSWGKLAGDVRDRWSRCWHRSCAFRDLLELN